MTRRAVIYSAVLSLCANYGSLFRMSSANRSSRAGKSPAVKLESATREISHRGAKSGIEVCNWRICFAYLEMVSGECRYAIEQAKVYFVGLSRSLLLYAPGSLLLHTTDRPLLNIYSRLLLDTPGRLLLDNPDRLLCYTYGRVLLYTTGRILLYTYSIGFYFIPLVDFYSTPLVPFYFISLGAYTEHSLLWDYGYCKLITRR